MPSGGCKAEDGEQDDHADETSAATNGSFAAHVDRPLGQQTNSGKDEQQRPPAAVPVQNELATIWPVTMSNAIVPTVIRMIGPTIEGTRGP